MAHIETFAVELWHKVQQALRSPRWRGLVQVFLMALSLLLLGLILYKNRDQLTGYRWSLDFRFILPAFILHSIDLALAIGGWHRIYTHLGAPLSLREDVKTYCLFCAARRLPGGIWGFASRILLYTTAGMPSMLTVVSIAMETLLIALTGLALSLGFLLFCSPWNLSWGMPALVAIAFIFGGLVVRPQILQTGLAFLLRRLRQGDPIAGKHLNSREMLIWSLWYLLVWLLGGLFFYTNVRIVYPLPPGQFLDMVGLWVVAGTVNTLLYFVPTGLWVTEISLAVLVSHYIPTPAAVVGTVLARLVVAAGELLWLLASLRL